MLLTGVGGLPNNETHGKLRSSVTVPRSLLIRFMPIVYRQTVLVRHNVYLPQKRFAFS
jgi:hypothetical protein